jgi:thiol-disulfide isomerase/thioredoxin
MAMAVTRTLRATPGLSALAVVLALAGCGTPTPPGSPAARGGGVEMVAAAPDGDVPTLLVREQARATKDGKQLLVYVGATWCEPCRRFHAAAAAHELDRDFPSLRLVEFDSDRDSERLAAAGYVSRLIPMFARPGADGRATGRQIEGSVKGDGAVAAIAPRLRTLLTP